MEIEFLKKITAKHLIGDLKDAIKGKTNNDVIPLYRVFGIANGVRTGSTQYGPWTAFVGTFEAFLLSEDGEVAKHVAAAQVFLHDPVEGMLINAMRDKDAVEFCVDVKLRVDETMPRGYEFIETPIIQAHQADSLANLRQAALPAPKKDVKEDVKPAKTANAKK